MQQKIDQKSFVFETIACGLVSLNKRDFFQLNWIGSDEWILKRYCDADFNSAWARLPRFLWKVPLKRDFLVIFWLGFGVRNFGNTKSMRVIFIFKMFTI